MEANGEAAAEAAIGVTVAGAAVEVAAVEGADEEKAEVDDEAGEDEVEAAEVRADNEEEVVDRVSTTSIPPPEVAALRADACSFSVFAATAATDDKDTDKDSDEDVDEDGDDVDEDDDAGVSSSGGISLKMRFTATTAASFANAAKSAPAKPAHLRAMAVKSGGWPKIVWQMQTHDRTQKNKSVGV